MALYLAVAGAGVLLTRHGQLPAAPAATADASRVVLYLPTIVVQLLLAFYVARVGRPRNELLSLVGERWTTAQRACVDMALAAALWTGIRALELLWARLSGGQIASVGAIWPRTGVERLAWIVLSLIVGTSEELVFRGYLRIQLGAFSRSAWVAILLQAILFGVAHAEQGAASAARIAVYGLAFGVVAHFRKSIVPCVLAHVATDLVSGLSH